MRQFLLIAFLAATVFSGRAITYKYDNFDASKKTCRLLSWGGNQPTSGKLVLKDTYEKDGVTYKINAIAPHALDNLTEVTEITIGANIKEIGSNCYATPWAAAENFYNCSKLTTFKVADGNSFYMATTNGLLIRKEKDEYVLVRVPQKFTTANGKLIPGSSIETIARNAFHGNSTITTLVLPPNLEAQYIGGAFTGMKKLTSFEVNSNNREMEAINGVLYTVDRKTLLAFPQAASATKFNVPSSVTAIGECAFQGSRNLNEIGLSSVTTIGKNAFANSALTVLTIPASVTEIEAGAFRSSKKLEAVDFRGKLKLGDAAFKNCKNLASANLSPELTLERDSIFAETGFTKISFMAGVEDLQDWWNLGGIGNYCFADCANLVELDLTQYNNNGSYMHFGLDVTSGCPKLTNVKLPKSTSFSGGSDGRSNFGTNSNISMITIGKFLRVGTEMLRYTSGKHTVNIYNQATANGVEHSPFAYFFEVKDGATLTPRIYIDAYKLSNKIPYSYVVPGAEYFIPGGTILNYQDAVDTEGCKVKEIYNIRLEESFGRVFLESKMPPRIQFKSIEIDGKYSAYVGKDGYAPLGSAVHTGKTLTVKYTLDGVEFQTDYPLEELRNAGIDDVTADAAPLSYEIHTLAGIAVTAGSGAPDLSALTPGIYIVTTRLSDGRTHTEKHLVR